MEISCVTCALACQTFVVRAGHEAFYIYACIYGDVIFPLRSGTNGLFNSRLEDYANSIFPQETIVHYYVLVCLNSACKEVSKEDERSSGEGSFEMRRQDHRKSMFNNEWLPPIKIRRFSFSYPLLFSGKVESQARRVSYHPSTVKSSSSGGPEFTPRTSRISRSLLESFRRIETYCRVKDSE